MTTAASGDTDFHHLAEARFKNGCMKRICVFCGPSTTSISTRDRFTQGEAKTLSFIRGFDAWSPESGKVGEGF